jgi:AAA+ superfamily predicted ATPase/predicted DNA-binding protein
MGTLGIAALALVSKAEEVARDQHLAKRTALPLVLREYLESAGYEIEEVELTAAVEALERVRRGEALPAIQIRVGSGIDYRKNGLAHSSGKHHIERKREPMVATLDSPNMISFFEAERIYPDVAAQRWYERLVGLDDHKARLLIELEMLLYPERLEQWSKRHHAGQVLKICELYGNRVPLILFEGDVGTGKTALAETIGDALARRVGEGRQVHMLKINTQIRGTGQVGEMSDLIVQAFAQVEARAKALGGDPVLLLLDEADALAVSRETQQMHHEDKAGLNTLLQRLDKLRLTRLPIAALFITNRPGVLDPAIRRRAALDLHFARPGDDIRAQILFTSVPELGLGEAELADLVRLTGPSEPKNKGVSFTASDLTDRLLPAALRSAYSEKRALQVRDIIKQAQMLEPTPPPYGTATQKQ